MSHHLYCEVGKHSNFSGYFDLCFNVSLHAKGTVLKSRSLGKIIKIKERLDVCDIRRIRNPKTKQTFR